ncbi:MAG: alpha/beta hydrolase [Segetibacter sp.]|jgi:pimeloyl-ACP methyl ester carboxylesterase|nr:alpha/beta hydrolase [Segetibacter sp.]
MKKVYFIAGLGADKRAFTFLDLSFCNPQFIEWVTPSNKETLASYAEKLFTYIKDEEAIIVGLSFGGMLATEMAKNHPRTKVIVISSSKTHLEIPNYLRFWRHFPIYKLHSNKIKNRAGGFVLSILGAKGVEQKKLQLQIMKDSDPIFTRWAMDAIVNWRNIVVPENITHIHGTADKLLPYRYVKADYAIKGGEHVMVMDRPQEVSELLKQIIST